MLFTCMHTWFLVWSVYMLVCVNMLHAWTISGTSYPLASNICIIASYSLHHLAHNEFIMELSWTSTALRLRRISHKVWSWWGIVHTKLSGDIVAVKCADYNWTFDNQHILESGIFLWMKFWIKHANKSVYQKQPEQG
jgi:hypothetical protein